MDEYRSKFGLSTLLYSNVIMQVKLKNMEN